MVTFPQEKKFYEEIARHYLRFFSNVRPSSEQIKVMQNLLIHVFLPHKIIFNQSQRLSQREKECLYHAAYGRTIQETARLLGVTVSTIKTQRAQLIRKLACHSMTQAVRLCLGFGLHD